MNRDFVILPEEAWNLFLEWYGGGPAIPRRVINARDKKTIELYPPLITSVVAGKDGKPMVDSQ